MWEHPSNTQVKKLKKQYSEIYPFVETFVNELDPIGLIKGGAPNDEYDCISVQLISLLKQGSNKEEIYEFIIHEIDDHFGMGINSISNEYKEKFIKKYTDFSEIITGWYKDNKDNFK